MSYTIKNLSPNKQLQFTIESTILPSSNKPIQILEPLATKTFNKEIEGGCFKIIIYNGEKDQISYILPVSKNIEIDPEKENITVGGSIFYPTKNTKDKGKDRYFLYILIFIFLLLLFFWLKK